MTKQASHNMKWLCVCVLSLLHATASFRSSPSDGNQHLHPKKLIRAETEPLFPSPVLDKRHSITRVSDTRSTKNGNQVPSQEEEAWVDSGCDCISQQECSDCSLQLSDVMRKLRKASDTRPASEGQTNGAGRYPSAYFTNTHDIVIKVSGFVGAVQAAKLAHLLQVNTPRVVQVQLSQNPGLKDLLVKLGVRHIKSDEILFQDMVPNRIPICNADSSLSSWRKIGHIAAFDFLIGKVDLFQHVHNDYLDMNRANIVRRGPDVYDIDINVPSSEENSVFGKAQWYERKEYPKYEPPRGVAAVVESVVGSVDLVPYVATNIGVILRTAFGHPGRESEKYLQGLHVQHGMIQMFLKMIAMETQILRVASSKPIKSFLNILRQTGGQDGRAFETAKRDLETEIKTLAFDLQIAYSHEQQVARLQRLEEGTQTHFKACKNWVSCDMCVQKSTRIKLGFGGITPCIWVKDGDYSGCMSRDRADTYFGESDAPINVELYDLGNGELCPNKTQRDFSWMKSDI